MYSQKYGKVYTAVGLVCAANQITDHRKTNGGLGCQQDLHSEEQLICICIFLKKCILKTVEVIEDSEFLGAVTHTQQGARDTKIAWER